MDTIHLETLLNTLSALLDTVPTNRNPWPPLGPGYERWLQNAPAYEGRLDGIWATLIAVRQGLLKYQLDQDDLYHCINQTLAPFIEGPTTTEDTSP